MLLELTHFNDSKFKIVKKYQWNLIMIHYVDKSSQKYWLITFKKSQKGDFLKIAFPILDFID